VHYSQELVISSADDSDRDEPVLKKKRTDHMPMGKHSEILETGDSDHSDASNEGDHSNVPKAKKGIRQQGASLRSWVWDWFSRTYNEKEGKWVCTCLVLNRRNKACNRIFKTTSSTTALSSHLQNDHHIRPNYQASISFIWFCNHLSPILMAFIFA
jgi:hypothetical protein